MEKAEVAIIGGTGFEKMFANAVRTSVKTPYGSVSPIFVAKVGCRQVACLPRHGLDHSVPPHKVNYRAHVCALHRMGVKRILATNAVGAINHDFKPGDVIVPHDFVDFTRSRSTTFYDKAPVTHIDVSQPYCPEIRGLFIENARALGLKVWDKAVLVCTEGPRFETPAEIEMLRRLGCDIVGMTDLPGAVLAKELEMCYATACYVSNMAAGMQQRLTVGEVSKFSHQVLPKVEQALIETAKSLPLDRAANCSCATALRNARFE